MVRQMKVDRFAPRTGDIIGPQHIVGAIFLGARRDIEIVAALVAAQFGRPDRADVALQRRCDRGPVHQICRAPDHQAGNGFERGERHVVDVAVLQDRRVGPVARHDGVEEAAVVQVRATLAFKTAAPVLARPFLAEGRQLITGLAGGQGRCGQAGRSRAGGQSSEQPPSIDHIRHFARLPVTMNE
ncbi:hypothetical protein D3C73_1026380 [compost metagenome]